MRWNIQLIFWFFGMHCSTCIDIHSANVITSKTKHFSFLHAILKAYIPVLITSTMKFPTKPKQAVSLLLIFMLVLPHASATILSPVVHAQKNCDFPAIFNLGDSNSDTGGYAACFDPPTSPYGDTYFHMPARRFSDGRLMIDFIGIYNIFNSIVSTSVCTCSSVILIVRFIIGFRVMELL